MRIAAVLLVSFLATTTCANAHLGHIGEVAGHAHWIGIGAVIVAGALAGLIGKGLVQSEDEVEDAPSEEIDAEGEPA